MDLTFDGLEKFFEKQEAKQLAVFISRSFAQSSMIHGFCICFNNGPWSRSCVSLSHPSLESKNTVSITWQITCFDVTVESLDRNDPLFECVDMQFWALLNPQKEFYCKYLTLQGLSGAAGFHYFHFCAWEICVWQEDRSKYYNTHEHWPPLQWTSNQTPARLQIVWVCEQKLSSDCIFSFLSS